MRTVTFGLSNSVSLNKDTMLVTTGKIDTINDYTKNQTSAYLLRTSEVWRVYLQSNDPSYTLDNLAYARLLIGTDTVAIDTLPQGSTDLNFILTKKDVTQFMKDTSFTASLQCNFLSAPKNPTTLTCGMTVIYTALAQ